VQQTKIAILEFEEAREEYRRKDAIGIPMSVREWYEKTLSEIRSRIREERNTEGGKRLGEILVDSGLLDQEALRQGLAEQLLRGTGELLGEVLLSLNLVTEDTLMKVLRTQANMNWAGQSQG